jgi:type II secretory ATPase GspE/PulE/Tfp pilus assembly ATPase PilB-like protein
MIQEPGRYARQISYADKLTLAACSLLDIWFLNLSEMQVDVPFLRSNWGLCVGEKVVPLFSDSLYLIVASSTPWDDRLVRRIRRKTRMQVETVGASTLFIDRIFASVGKPVSDLFSEGIEEDSDNFTLLTGWDSSKSPIQMARDIIRTAHQQGASDIHLEPWSDRLVIRFRIHGRLETMPPLSKREGDELIRTFKQMGNLPVSEVQSCSSSRISCNVSDNKTIDLRLEKQPVINGEQIVCRVLDDTLIRKSAGKLPFSNPRDVSLVKSVLNKSSGMFVTTGPTGSGKTTTNYLCIASLDREGRKIITAEDPIEYVMEGVQQVQINPEHGDRTFANVLRSNLRCDPEVLIVGEIRDEVTAEISSRSVQTGHLVMATLHTNDAIGVIPRLMGLGISPALVSQILSVVVSQRLCCKLCDNCKTPVQPTPEILEHYDFYQMEQPEVIYEISGCKECKHTGTVGLFPIFEILHMTKHLRALIGSPFDEMAFREAWVKQGGRTLATDGLERVKEGITPYEEVAKYDEDFIPGLTAT